MFIPVSNPDWSIFSTLWSYAPYVFSLERWVRLGISAFAPLSLLLLLMPLRYTFHLREATPAHLLVVLIFAASFLGGDAERLVSPALFFLLIIFREQLSLLLLSRRFGILLAFAVLICSNHFLFHAHPLMTREWYYGSSMILSIIVAVAGYMTMKRHVGTNEEAHYGGDEQPA
jgi:hypothetical protein